MAIEVQYKNICGKLTSTPCIGRNLKLLKEEFRSDDISERRLDNINNIRDLIRVLEKRDCLSVDCITPLRLIATTLDRKDVSALIDCYGITQSSPSPNLSCAPINNQRVLPLIPHDVKERVYSLICSEMGHKWKEFARALSVREGGIDNLDHRYRDIAEKVREVLLFHEDNCDQRRWRSLLVEGLAKARRRDLAKNVQEIFDTHSR